MNKRIRNKKHKAWLKKQYGDVTVDQFVRDIRTLTEKIDDARVTFFDALKESKEHA